MQTVGRRRKYGYPSQGRGPTGAQGLGVFTVETAFKSVSLEETPKGVSADGKEGQSKA